MTMWLTLDDERVRACVPSGCMNHFRERSQKLSSCGIQFPFGCYATVTCLTYSASSLRGRCNCTPARGTR